MTDINKNDIVRMKNGTIVYVTQGKVDGILLPTEEFEGYRIIGENEAQGRYNCADIEKVIARNAVRNGRRIRLNPVLLTPVYLKEAITEYLARKGYKECFEIRFMSADPFKPLADRPIEIEEIKAVCITTVHGGK